MGVIFSPCRPWLVLGLALVAALLSGPGRRFFLVGVSVVPLLPVWLAQDWLIGLGLSLPWFLPRR